MKTENVIQVVDVCDVQPVYNLMRFYAAATFDNRDTEPDMGRTQQCRALIAHVSTRTHNDVALTLVCDITT